MENSNQPLIFTDEGVNILLYPEKDKKHMAIAGHQITLGDLHGNALKLLYSLVRHDFIAISPEDYTKFVEIYKKESEDVYSQTDIDDINNILNNITITDSAKSATLCLIGDELCDRGSCDYFTLKILEKLILNHIPVNILLSNHSADFLAVFEKGFEKLEDSTLYRASEAQTNSLNSLFYLMEKDTTIEITEIEEMIGIKISDPETNAIDAIILDDMIPEQTLADPIISKNAIIALVKTSYLPTLKLIHYTLNQEKNNITLYSHAPIGLDNLSKIAEQMNVTYNADSILALANTIEKINQQFQAQYVQKNKISELLALPYAHLNPCYHLLWNRETNPLYRPANITNIMDNSHFTVEYAHGHTTTTNDLPHIKNLDNNNELGKNEKSYKGVYNILYSPNITLTIEDKKILTENEEKIKQTEENNKQKRALFYKHKIKSEMPNNNKRTAENAELKDEKTDTKKKKADKI